MRYGMMLLAALGCVPSVAYANQLRLVSYDMDDSGGLVRLASDSEIGEPWLRVEGRSVRIWFPKIKEIARFDHERDGNDPIHALSLRPGTSDTAVLKIELGSPHKIKPSDIEIIRQAGEASVRVRVPQPAALAPPAATTAQAGVPLSIQRIAQPASSIKPEAAAQPVPVETPPVNTQPLATLGSETETATSAAVSRKREPAATESLFGSAASAAPLAKESKPTVLYLVFASLVLGALYAGLQYNHKRRRPAALQRPEIEVLGARRLGHRQELVIVRALGSDHLLLCTGGRAERVASTPTPVALPAPGPGPKGPDDSQAGGLGLISRLSSHHRLRKLLDSVDQELPQDEAEAPPGEPATSPRLNGFGAELFSATRKQQQQQRAQLYSVPPAPPARDRRQSEAVAGLDRLRKRVAT